MRFIATLFGNTSLDTQLLTLVAEARARRTIGLIENLLRAGANPSAEDQRAAVSQGLERQAPLHYAYDWPMPERLQLVRLLLNAGANARAKSKYGHTPLHLFAIRNYVDEMRLLLDAGANANACNSSGHTPLHNAAGFGDSAAVGLLLDSGADPNAYRKRGNLCDGYTPLHSAVTHLGGDIEERLEAIRLLVRSGAKLTRTQEGYRPGTPLEAAVDFQKTVLHGYNPSEEDRRKSAVDMERIITLLERLARSA